ncbi:hypothetical protein BGW41_001328 [Actinomortierella wolfii]|nr:hypothetical protein BGW41_001328 [Actinomortierella wolfii]
MQSSAPSNRSSPSIVRPHRRRHSFPLSVVAFVLATCLKSPDAFVDAQSVPKPVGGFAICQTPSSVHIQGGISYSDDATYLTLSNQHFRLDLSQAFSATTAPTWVDLTSDESPYQAYHTGACTPDKQSFLTVGNAMEKAGSKTGLMWAYSITKGGWSIVSKVTNNPESAGRTMVGFAIDSGGRGNKAAAGRGLIVGGGLLELSAPTASRPATDLKNIMDQADLISFDGDGSLGTLELKPRDAGAKGDRLGSNAATSVVILPGEKNGGPRALVLGGLASGSEGISFAQLPVVDLTTGEVTISRARADNNASIPSARYGHCAVASSDGNSVVMYGGAAIDSGKPSNEVHVLDVRTWTWSQPPIKGTPPAPVRNHQCIMVGDQLITFFGFNHNNVPRNASGSSASTLNVLSTSQWAWSNNYTPLPNTPAPPAPPSASSGDSGSKPNGLAIGFGVVFSLAFLSVIVYSVWAHQKRKLKKREMILLVELDRQRKEAEEERKKAEKLKQAQPQPELQGYDEREPELNLTSHGDYNGLNYGAQEYNPYYASTVAAPVTSAPYQHAHYGNYDMYQQPPTGYATTNQFSNAAYPQPPMQMMPPPVPPKPNQDNPFIPEEMGSSSYEVRAPQVVLTPHPHYAGATNGKSTYRDSTRI